MTIDPVVMLAEDIRATEAALEKASRLYAAGHCRRDGDLVNLLLGRVKRLYAEIHDTVPTSALGAAELVRMAARRLPFAHARYAAHLHEIADRLSAGCRLHADLVWLRALEAAMGEGACGKDGTSIKPWLRLAVIGASRPVVVFRAIAPSRGVPPWRHILAQPGAA